MSHASIDATLSIVQEHALVAEEIREIRVSLTSFPSTGPASPGTEKDPQTVGGALFSIPFESGLRR